MAKKKYEETNIQAIAEAIREKTGTGQTYKTSEMASGVNEVYDKGIGDGWSQFWDIFQRNGARTDYGYAFCEGLYAANGLLWTPDNFKPKYNLKPSAAPRMFRRISWNTWDFKEIFDNLDVTLDFSNCIHMEFAFGDIPNLVRMPVMNMSKSTANNYLFNETNKLHTIEKIISSKSTAWGNNVFMKCTSLANVVFEGEIAKTISFQYSPLTVESMKSVISCLTNYKGTSSEATQKVTFTSACWEALEAGTSPYEDGLTDDDTMTWQNYVTEVLGWNI